FDPCQGLLQGPIPSSTGARSDLKYDHGTDHWSTARRRQEGDRPFWTGGSSLSVQGERAARPHCMPSHQAPAPLTAVSTDDPPSIWERFAPTKTKGRAPLSPQRRWEPPPTEPAPVRRPVRALLACRNDRPRSVRHSDGARMKTKASGDA